MAWHCIYKLLEVGYLPAGICGISLNRLNAGDKHPVPSDPCGARIHIHFSLQVTTTKAVTDARKTFQLMLLQTVQLRFTEVDTGSQEFQFSGHRMTTYSMKADQSHPRDGRNPIFYIHLRL